MTDPARVDTRGPWSATDHRPCLNWVRAREGCDGRHHLRDCPLPRPVGVVGQELDLELLSEPEPAPAPAPAPSLSAAATAAAAPAETVVQHEVASPNDLVWLFGGSESKEVTILPQPHRPSLVCQMRTTCADCDVGSSDLLMVVNDPVSGSSSWAWKDN